MIRQREADHAGNNKDEYGQQFEESGEDAASSGFRFVFGGEGALNDVLVCTPVPQPDNRSAQQHPDPRVERPLSSVFEVPCLCFNLTGFFAGFIILAFDNGFPGQLVDVFRLD